MLVAAGQGEIEALRKAEVDVSPNPDSLSSSNLARHVLVASEAKHHWHHDMGV